MRSPIPCGLKHAALLLIVLVPSLATGEVLPLSRVLEQVETHDPSLEAARQEAAAARSRVRRAGAWDAPMLELMAENVPANGRFDMEPMTMRVVGLQQRLDVFGARGLARRAARVGALADAAMVEDRRWDRYAMAWTAYADAYFAGERANAAKGHYAFMSRMAAAARARYESGRGRLDDLLRVEAERARVTADGVMFASEQHGALLRLAALRGLPAWPAGETLEAPPETLAADGDPVWDEVVAGHPRVRAAAGRAAARRGSALSMKRMAWPELTVRASYGFRSMLANGQAQDNMWSAGVGIMLPIGAGAREGAEAAEMIAMADAATAEQHAEELSIAAELGALRAEAAASRRNVSLLSDTVLVAQRRAMTVAWSGYETGATDLGGVFDTAHDSYSEELEVSRARQQLARTLARLLAVTARGDLFGMRVPDPRATTQVLGTPGPKRVPQEGSAR